MRELFEAVAAGDGEALRAMLAKDPAAASSRDDEGISLVLSALYRGREDLASIILATHPQLDVFDAAALGKADRLAELTDDDPGLVNAWSADGFTPLHLAVFFGHPEAARLLLERSADVAAVSKNRMAVMPLHSAVAGTVPDRRAGIAGLLLDHGAEVNAPTHLGFTPLQEAAQNGDRATVVLLLAHAADPGLRKDDGKTAADLARDAGHRQLAELLEGAARNA